jgi:hypothetical protein
MLGRLLNALDPRTPSADGWLREGWPAVVPIVLVGLVPSFIAAPIRVLTGAPIWLALSLGALVTVALVWPFRRALAARKLDDRGWAALGVTLLVAATSVVVFFNRDFAGLPTYETPDRNVAIDAAAHVLNSWAFGGEDRDPYGGFASLYAFWNLLHGLFRQNYVVASNVSFYLGVAVVVAAPSAVAFSLLHRFSRSAFFLGASVCLVSTLLLAWYVVLPLLAMQLVGGFWPHAFGLIPLFGLWFVDAWIRPRVVRVLALVLFAALYRFTYGINLPELMVSVAVLIFVEAAGPGLPRVTRIAGVLAGLAILPIAWLVYERLAKIFGAGGWTVAHDFHQVWRGELICAAAFAFGMWFWPAREAARGTGIVRALRFPALFGFTSAMTFSLLLARPDAQRQSQTLSLDYYYQKHDLHAALLTACAATVLLAFAAAQLIDRRSRRAPIAALIALVLAVVGPVEIARGVESYRAISTEIVSGKPPYPRLRPWVDVEALRVITRTLRAHHAQLGGYLGTWTLSSFLNATLGHGRFPHSQPQPVDTKPGYCVFQAGGPNLRSRIPRKDCVSYHSRWDWPGRNSWICSMCY